MRTIVSTIKGYRVYGFFGAIMDIDFDGQVIYTNVNYDCEEYAMMYQMFTAYR